MIIPSLTILILALAVLMASGHWIVKLLNNITSAFGLSEFTAAFLLLAMATSVPELFMGIASAKQNAGEIVLAIALGSMVVNITLIISLAALISGGIRTTEKQLRQNIGLSISIGALPLLFLIDGVISRTEGLILIAVFILYLIILYRNRPVVTMLRQSPARSILKGFGSIALVFGLLAVLLLAADKTVESAVSLAGIINTPPFLIGLFLLAIGTSLPELTTTLQSAWQRRPNMAIGNILGSNAADAVLVIGVAAAVKPLHIEVSAYIGITIFFVILANATLAYFALSRQRISITESVILLCMFVVFVITVIFTGAPILLDAHT